MHAKKIVMRFCLAVFFSFLIMESNSQTDDVGSGRAITLDGVNDYIQVGNYKNINLPFTISAWVFVDPTSVGANPIFVTNDNNPNYRGFWFSISSGAILCEFGDGAGGNNPAFRQGKLASINNVLGRWNHVCAVMTSPSNITLYINGVDVGGNPSGQSSLTMASSYTGDTGKIGYFLSNGVSYFFKGSIDEVRLWNRALTSAEVKQSMCKKLIGTESGLAAYWNFNETSGTIVNDNSSSHQNGTFVGGVKRIFSGAPIGDDSKYQYSSSWSGTTFSFQDNNDVVSINNILGNPEGIHIYEVKSLPSQTGGLNTSQISQPYFGVFAASLHTNNSFDLTYKYQGVNYCKLNLRKDNSTAAWSISNNPATNLLQQIEVIKGGSTQTLSFSLGVDQSLCELKPFTLQPLKDPTGLTFTWQDNSHQSTFLVSDYGKYWVTVSDGCSLYTDTITFTKPLDKISLVPNAITPNGDTTNQYFKIDDGLKGNVSLLVLNRWGKEVYKSSSYKNDWDGGGLSPGTYYIVISGPCIEEVRDWLTIIH